MQWTNTCCSFVHILGQQFVEWMSIEVITFEYELGNDFVKRFLQIIFNMIVVCVNHV